MSVTGRLDATDHERLLEHRTGLRRFRHWSETQARTVGLTPAQHQPLLAIRGHPDPRGPTIGDIADYLVPHRGTGRVSLTHPGGERLDSLAGMHVEELARLAPTVETLWRSPAASR